MKEHFRSISDMVHYERLALVRSRLFMLFALALTAFVIYLLFSRLTLADGDNWVYRAIPSVVPYMVMKYISAIESVFAIFLLFECHFYEPDTVFLNHPPSNADYYAGKILAFIQLFLRLNLLLLVLAFVFHVTAQQAQVDLCAYAAYWLLFTIPSLVFVLGLTTCAMLLFKHPSIVLLFVPGVLCCLFWFGRRPELNWLDFSAFHLPMFRSSVAGWIFPAYFLRSRLLFLSMGLALCCLAAGIMPRRSGCAERKWEVSGFLVLTLLTAVLAGHVVMHRHAQQAYRAELVSLDDAYSDHPLWQISHYAMDVRQQRRSLEVCACMTGTPLEAARSFVFCLNPGFQVDDVQDSEGVPLHYTRKEHLLFVEFAEEQHPGDTTVLQISYHGRADQRICFLDLGDRWIDGRQQIKDIVLPVSNLEQRPRYCLLTPDAYWYPKTGTAYAEKSWKWQRQWFSTFDMHIVPRPHLFPVTQGFLADDSDGYRYVSDVPVPSLTLAVGAYERITAETPSVDYHVVYLKGHDYFRPALDSLGVRVAEEADGMRRQLEHAMKLPFLASQYTLLEVPVSYASFQRDWMPYANIQPELSLIPEKAVGLFGADLYSAYLKNKNSGEAFAGDSRMMAFFDMLQELVMGSKYSIDNMLHHFTYDVWSPVIPSCNSLVSLLSYRFEPRGEHWDQGAHFSGKSLAEWMEQGQVPQRMMVEKMRELWLYGELEAGHEAFRDALMDIIHSHPFTSLTLEQVYDALADSLGCDLNGRFDAWYHAKEVPSYRLGPVSTSVQKDKQDTRYVVSQTVTNESAVPGIVMAGERLGRTDPMQIVEMPPFSSRRIVFVTAAKPYDYTLALPMSQNLPGMYDYSFIGASWSTAPGEAGVSRVEEMAYTDSEYAGYDAVVDNESELFLWRYAQGRRKKQYAKLERPKDDYLGDWTSPARHPMVWRSVLSKDFFGGHIRSACIVRSTSQGAPEQEAVWAIPVHRAGRYIVSYYFNTPSSSNKLIGFPDVVLNQVTSDDKESIEKQIRKLDLNYHFRLWQAGGPDKSVVFKPYDEPGRYRRELMSGWLTVDTLDLKPDTLYFSLSNRTDLKLVMGDAVRIEWTQ